MSWLKQTFNRAYDLPDGCPDPRRYPHRWTDIPERGVLVATHAPITGPKAAIVRTIWYANHGDPTIQTIEGLSLPWEDAWAWCEVVREVARAVVSHRLSRSL